MGLCLAHIKALVYDFDGVMTDNKAFLFPDGSEAIQINRSDGMAVQMFKEKGFCQLILTSEHNVITDKRAAKLDIPILHSSDKLYAAQAFFLPGGITLNEVCFVGNDLNDIPLLKNVGLPVCPADAYPEVKGVCKMIVPVNGGQGVIRGLWGLCYGG